MPIGRMPGHLSSAMSRQTTEADSPLGSTKLEHIHLPMAATALHRSTDVDLKEVDMRFHAAASNPKGPAAPSVLMVVLRIVGPSIFSKRMGWSSIVGASLVTREDCLGGCAGECFFDRISTVSSVGFGQVQLSRLSGLPQLLSEINRIAALTLPSIIDLVKVLVFCSIFADVGVFD